VNIDELTTGRKGDSYLNCRDMPIIMRKVYNFTVVIEKGDDGFYIGSVPSLRGCHTQGKTMDELLENIKEAIELCLQEEKDIPEDRFVGTQKVQVRA
jgi:predicted RNase H-like HicB family nuclease